MHTILVNYSEIILKGKNRPYFERALKKNIEISAQRTGAGLKNIERRVTLLNGKMTLNTAPNKGTCYTIEVPLDATVKLRKNS